MKKTKRKTPEARGSRVARKTERELKPRLFIPKLVSTGPRTFRFADTVNCRSGLTAKTLARFADSIDPNSNVSIQELEATVGKFLAGVKKLRAKHAIADVLIAVGGTCIGPEGKLGPFVTVNLLGDPMHGELLAAQALAQARTRREMAVAEALEGKPPRRNA